MELKTELYSKEALEKMPLCLDEYRDGSADKFLYLMWNYCGGICYQMIEFDPWSGEKWFAEEDWNIRCILTGLGLLDDFDGEYPNEHYIYAKHLRQRKLERYRAEHRDGMCSALADNIDEDDGHGCPLIYIPNIRTYAILNRKEFGGWTAIDYCPFCGSKLPPRLDGILSKILRLEYSLSSWRDYKKAPPEFKTDEWWRKRGL